MLSLTREGPYLILGNKGKYQPCGLNFASFLWMKLNHSLLYDDAVNDMRMTFLIVWSNILDGRSLSYFNIELCTLHTQTIQSSQLPYIGNFSRGFNFRWVRDLPEIAKNRHSEKLTLLYVFIDCPWNSENRTQWKFKSPSKINIRQNFPTRKIPDIRYIDDTSFIAAMTFGGSTLILGSKYDQ